MRKFVTFCLLLSCLSALSQRISDFSLAQSGSSVTTHFTLRAGSVCSGYSVMHSRDSITFLEVVSHNASCGTTGADEFYSDVHSTPAPNQFNYYKIQLTTFESSPVKKIWVGSGASQYLMIFPNPVNPLNNAVTFSIPGISGLRVQGFVRDIRGFEWLFVDEITKPAGTPISLPDVPEGVYSLWLTDGTNVYKGKFIVFH